MSQKKPPRTFESAVKRANEYGGRILWPPIWESVEALEEQFPHLRNVWPMVPKRRAHRKRVVAEVETTGRES